MTVKLSEEKNLVKMNFVVEEDKIEEMGASLSVFMAREVKE